MHHRQEALRGKEEGAAEGGGGGGGARFSPWSCACGAEERCVTEVVEVKNLCPYQMGCVPSHPS